MTTEEKFNAAVNVIRSLPKNGSYQPSNDLMLRFYGYFKQATQGSCKGSRPAFWDVVGRAKYDAWKRLGDMPNKDAMAKYVEELHTIVETMSYSDKVASFLDAPSSELDNLKIEDLQLVVGDVIERVRSQPNSPLASREASPNRLVSNLSSSRSISPEGESESDHSDGEYVDTIETLEPKKMHVNGISACDHQCTHKPRAKMRLQQEVSEVTSEIKRVIQKLQVDINQLTNKVNTLEKSKHALVRRKKESFGVSRRIIIFIIVWPIVTNFIMNRFRRRC